MIAYIIFFFFLLIFFFFSFFVLDFIGGFYAIFQAASK